MGKQFFGAVVGNDKTVPLGVVEPFDSALKHNCSPNNKDGWCVAGAGKYVAGLPVFSQAEHAQQVFYAARQSVAFTCSGNGRLVIRQL